MSKKNRNPKILCIILIHGRSKGLPGKNIIPVLGKPLIAYTIDAALRSKFITKTVISSDDAEILRNSELYGTVSLQRPDELAQDTSTSENAIYHVPEIKNKRSQDLPKYYRLNGAIYISKIEYLKENNGFLGENTKAYIMPKIRSVDIDTEIDYEFCKTIFKTRINKQRTK